MRTRVAINGFGRIGRAVLRAARERGADTGSSDMTAVTTQRTSVAWIALDSARRFGPLGRRRPGAGGHVVLRSRARGTADVGAAGGP